MKKSFLISACMVLGLLMLPGCSNEIPDMTEESKDMVVEYAAAVVRKYDANRKQEFMELEELVALEESRAAEAAKEEAKEEESAEAESTLIPDEEVPVIESEEVEAPVTLESILQLEEMTLSYEGYETKAFYPDEGENLFFVMNATEGNELLVLHFNLQNHAQNEQFVDLISKGVRYKIEINGETKNVLTTMLLNDLSNYQETILQGSTAELVLICEIPTEQVNEISSLSLIVRSADEKTTISLN